MMRLKLSILVFGFLSIFAGEIKADKKICRYSKPPEFGNCLKRKNIQIIPNFPVDTFDHFGAMWIGDESQYSLIHSTGTVFKVLELRAPNKNEIEITIGDKEIGGIWSQSYSIGSKFKSSKTFRIKSEDIVSWKYYSHSKIGGGFFDDLDHLIYKLEISYLDEIGNLKTIKSNRSWSAAKPKRVEIITNLLSNISQIQKGEVRDINSILSSKLYRNEKNLTIIKSIINSNESVNENCFIAIESKFPDLTNQYRKLSTTINPLREKLDLPPNTGLKSICN